MLDLTLDMGEPVALNEIELLPDGEIRFKANGQSLAPKKANLSLFHERNNKEPKQIFNIPQETTNLSINLERSISDTNFIYVVDTNTTVIPNNGDYLSVGVVFEYENVNKEELIRRNSYVREIIHSERTIGEKKNLIELIKKIIQDKRLDNNPSVKIAIVTDHDLGNIDKYNARELPLMENPRIFLPPNFKLIYASADKKNDSILNQMISICDTEASRIIKLRLEKL